jgi:dTDP-4-dehydrorhamnose reductase
VDHQTEGLSLTMENITLIIGASGLLGSAIYRKFKASRQVYGTFFKSQISNDKNLIRLDATDATKLLTLIRDLSPSTVINCMGLTSVELCEASPELCSQLNTEIPMRLSQLSNSVNFRLIHISTDHFASAENRPRTESEPVFPINTYGYSKLLAENLILDNNPNALILRTNFFGHSRTGGRSLLDFALEGLISKSQLTGFADVLFSPVGVGKIAEFLLDERSISTQGILNFSSNEVISKFDFLTQIARIQKIDEKRVVRGLIRESDLTVARPNYLALEPSKLLYEVGFVMPSVEQMLIEEIKSHD